MTMLECMSLSAIHLRESVASRRGSILKMDERGFFISQLTEAQAAVGDLNEPEGTG